MRLPTSSDRLSHQLRELARQGHLDAAALERGFAVAGQVPDRADWRWLLNGLILLFGAGLALAGVVFFFAYNWAELHRFAKFGLLAGGIAAAAGGAAWLGLHTLPGKVALLAASVLLGPLLGVYGQVYQTGADPYGLFLTWALLIVPWTLISRFAVQVLLVLALLNLALILFWEQVLEPGPATEVWIFVLLFALNGLALVAWEVAAQRGVPWLRRRWGPRLLMAVALLCITVPPLWMIVDGLTDATATLGYGVGSILYLIALVGGFVWYRRRDLFGITLGAFSLLVLVTTLVGRLLEDVPGFQWIMAGIVLAELYAAVRRLRALYAHAGGGMEGEA